eukprot:TRINITY_DN10697_c0_g1_i1.p1 TRINITY_DN10697_c0_g1~~TRINITY_DN10697_c0_g1_i1.p1  ORF type:complete len:838 (-),score=144.62 TRINITY_DN10697_c0_g1_i1:57-2570(-)
MFRDRWVPPQDGIITKEQPSPATSGKSIKLSVNSFKMTWSDSAAIHHYAYVLSNPKVTPKEEQSILEQAWQGLEERFGKFVVRCPGQIFTSAFVKDFSLPLREEGQEIHIKYVTKILASQINDGAMGVSSVVAQHLVKMLAKPLRIQRVGRRYFNNCTMEGKAQLTMISGFCATLAASSTGAMLQLDVMHRPLHKESVIETMQKINEGQDVFSYISNPDMMVDWQRCCVPAIVVTMYNNRVYRVKKVHFDKTPNDTFDCFQREEKKYTKMKYAEYYQAFYDKKLTYDRQPLLECYPEKETEKVFLLPELCSMTGITAEIREDKHLLSEVMKQAKVAPQERLNAVQNLVGDMLKGQDSSATGEVPGATGVPKCLEDWGVSLSKTPVEVDARVLDHLQVDFGKKGSMKWAPEELGSWTKQCRNGLQCPAKIEDWIFVYPQADEPLLDIWLRSLQDIASIAFSMTLGNNDRGPKRVACSDQTKEIEKVLTEHLTPKTQLVLILIPAKDSKKVYQLLKKVTCMKLPCITQVVRSETIRKRHAIAQVLSRIVLQINAKLSGPLWHILPSEEMVVSGLDKKIMGPIQDAPTMVVGVDVFQSCEGRRYLGIVATLNKPFTTHYSYACPLEGTTVEEWRSSLSVKLQASFRDALLQFANANGKVMPEHIIVYRASINREEWSQVHATEVLALQEVLRLTRVKAGENSPKVYEPALCFITIAKRDSTRFFLPSPNLQNVKNPEPGTVVDSSVCCGSEAPNFYMISQSVGQKGTAVPAHYSVLCNTASLSMELIQNLTYRLCGLHFNSMNMVRLPAPVMYAKKIAHLVGTTLKGAPHPRLLSTLFYL